MPERLLANIRTRKSFSKIRRIIEIPDLIGIQRESFDRFLQRDIFPKNREDTGLQAVFKSVFPIRDFTGSASLEFVSYRFTEKKSTVEECMQRGMTYEIPLRITVRLVVYDIDKETGVSNIRDIKEQEIYFGTLPLMTDNGTFIVNGTERTVVSQLHRSSGVFYDHDKGKLHSSGKIIYSCRIIPVRGSWIDMEIDPKDIVNIRIDRRRKFPVTTFLKALGYTVEDLLAYFYERDKIFIEKNRYYKKLNPSYLKNQRAFEDIIDPDSGDVIIKKGRKFTKKSIKLLEKSNIPGIPIDPENIINKVCAETINDPISDEVIASPNEVIDEVVFDCLKEAGVTEFYTLVIDGVTSSDAAHKTLLLDKVDSKEEALVEIYRRMRPGNPATSEVAQDFMDNLFFKSAYYDLSGVGRLKINERLGIDSSIDLRTLRKEDILLAVKTLIQLRDSQGIVDDIDHLGNRRVRAVGELLENQYRIGLVRMERVIKERMSLQEVDALMPYDLINPKPVSAVVKEFFGTSQLSQFLDQTNPLSETTHKRRLSALGPGGLTRERAGFEVRDVHPSHYGRICPIETPEGPNIGLIVSLSTYARVNKYGFIETPYRSVKDAKVSDKALFFSAFEEKNHPIAQANAPMNEKGEYINSLVTSRVAGEFSMVDNKDIELMDVSPNQLVSVSASMVPFLENDDANRALMGSNMQRQAVPLLVSQAPLVGTGMEKVVAKDSGVAIVVKQDGIIQDVNASRIVLRHSDIDEEDNNEVPVTIYKLTKFVRSNQNTCFNHRPIVKIGQHVKAGDIIADGSATDCGELALGKDVTVAFMSWGGYNFEDSILVSERLVRDGVYTSIHIEEFEVVARDIKLGKEDITRDIPNVGEDALEDLDESGIVKLGAEVVQGDILVGKITPKGETQLSPEEKLLKAIFGEKAGDVKDTSLRVPPGVNGVVIDAKVFSRRGVDKDARSKEIDASEIEALKRERDDKLSVINEIFGELIEEFIIDQECAADLKEDNEILIAKGSKIDKEILSKIKGNHLKRLVLTDAKLTQRARLIFSRHDELRNRFRKEYEKKLERYEKGDDLPPGVIKMVKVYVAMKRKLSVGDKMAGRHGNKGVVSRILPQEDLPYFKDGTPVDMVLNPLGVPSRMNVGQVLEIHLGAAAKGLGDQINKLLEKKNTDHIRNKLNEIFASSSIEDSDVKKQIAGFDDDELLNFASQYKKGVHMATPVFDGAKEDEIKDLLTKAGLSTSGQAVLYDGRTGKKFKEKITVGSMYMLKLHHLVDDKIHARSIGPYSLVTQQPLGGKAQFGGQRLGEMEVWAMEAYGGAHSLQEFLTVKSDDMAGRTRMYEKIVKGQNLLEPGLPESFKVLTKELMSLGMDVTLLENKDKK